ncbi:hypothetical protein B0A55_09157 [Friedmanniomyces simplex]|uniref:Cytochrome P450 n=1 Tax=Friedmanniomyces simplex TaxID=329884 RepID=A0A4U0WP76_9PEZI|nr:hypothetical protein B0A55_09157 [Friedmanniomyces simplex]
MAPVMDYLGHALDAIPKAALCAIAPFAAVASILLLVNLYTKWQYYQTLRQFTDGPTTSKQQLVESPQIPYTLPVLGNTLSFLAPKPGHYWNQLFSWHPRSTGICTLLLGGRKTHILMSYLFDPSTSRNGNPSPSAVQALFKAKSPSRDVFERELFRKVFQLPEDQIHNAEAGKHHEIEMNSKYLTNHERVNELTAEFSEVLEEVLDQDSQEIVQLEEIGLYQWLRNRMFTASTRALMGDELLRMYPAYCEDFFGFDSDLLSFFFQLPKFMMGEAFSRRRRLLDELERWSKKMHELSGGTPVDPEGPSWEPLLGSRLNRARQLDYKTRNLNTRTGAALDLGLTFGLSSNADPSILARVMKELREAEKTDGSLDIAVLVSQPLLQSLWTETLRLYTDVLVTRNLSEDLTLPLDEDGRRYVRLRKGDNVFAPSWLGHHDAAAWSSPGKPADSDFYAERFVVKDAKTGRESFSTAGTAGKFFPFGGGKTVCPGRIFAKQEGLGALAMVLLRFDFEVLGFVDAKKNPTKTFPGYARAFAGSGAVVPGGDVRVKIRKRAARQETS